ncbi:MAG TPA: diaminobutyrate--2-oxoglutarate transaminase [Microbacteriaceae bacterium]|nr:diaminobutyrate--2-oxoglutarate transaminase [Microbacteriaceae bacterium]
MSDLSVFEQHESEVRGYIRAFPTVFAKAVGSRLIAEDGTEYLDFFAGAGTLNYGHNNPRFKPAILAHIEQDDVVHGLDMATTAKRDFIQSFQRRILAPRGLEYRLQFTGPTGANAVEAAIKAARIATGRNTVIAFTHGYHGLSLGALAATANRDYRRWSGGPLGGVVFAPFEGYHGPDVDTVAMLARMLDDPSSGVDTPAAIIVETIQGEGGVNVASADWLRAIRALATEHGIPFIVDDIQAGCGRTGDFFSFEAAGIRPDIVVLSKSLSGYGLPMSLVLLAPELDVWEPGGHTGTFRGNNLAFVGATAALETYWADDAFRTETLRKSAILGEGLLAIAARHPGLLEARGRGMFWGLASLGDPGLAKRLSRECFARGLVIETAGARDEVLKFLPAPTIEESELRAGLAIVEAAVAAELVGAGSSASAGVAEAAR